jgi:hypothetical protein
MPPAARLRPIFLLFLSGIALVIVIGISYLVISTVPAKNLPVQTPIASFKPALKADLQVLADWLVYEDKDAGISFRYPPDAVLETGTSEQHPYNFIRLVFKQTGQSSLILDIRENKAKSTPRELAAQAYEETSSQSAPKSLIDAEEKVSVGGLAASKYIIPPTLADFMLFIPDGDKMLVVYPGRNEDPVSGNTPAIDLFNQVLETFVFSAD